MLRPDALVTLRATIPDDAMTAGLLGTERSGHGVRIREDGLIATIGYLINEADSVWITGANRTTVPGFVVGNDFDSGFALIKPSLPLAGGCLELGRAGDLSVGDPVRVAASGSPAEVIDAEVVAKQEFAGRWEYLLDEAIFTAPPHQNWSGAALLDARERLCGIGSLIIQGFQASGSPSVVNMFVPIDLLVPVIEQICAQGRPAAPPRPWLGVLIGDDPEGLTIVGVYRHCPADEAGVRPGDVVLEVDRHPIAGLAEMLRSIWRLGSAGVTVPLTVRRGTQRRQLEIRSGDRATYLRKGTLQ